MKSNILRVMMHPLRMKIIQEIMNRSQATTNDIKSACGNCAQATLYRHVKILLDHEIIQVIDTHRIHGIEEKVYVINKDLNAIIVGNPSEMTKEDHLQLFAQFVITLMTDFSSYVNQNDALIHIERNIGYHSATMYLTDEELHDMMQEIGHVISKRLDYSSSEFRQLRKLSTIVTTSLRHKNKGE